MCRRYASYLPAEALSRIFGARNPLPNLVPTWNLAPTQLAPVVRRHPETGERRLDLLQWGLLPWWQQTVKRSRSINARAETVAKAHLYRGAFAQRRCIVPADAFYAFYEWLLLKGRRQPYAIARQDGQPMAFAGLWESFLWPDVTVIRTFTIITTDAGPDVAELHSRMPVILESADWPAWLGEVDADPAALLHPSPEGTLRVWPVDRRVGSPKNNGPALIERIELAES
jgi:putative SOS response-associated peptidase YedK